MLMNKVKIMNRVLIVIFAYVFLVSCGEKRETKNIVSVDSEQEDSIRLAKQTDSIAFEKYYDEEQVRTRREAEREEQRKYDSILQHRTDSLRKAIIYIKSHRNINISQRIRRIESLAYSDKWIWGNLEGESDRDELLGHEIGLLMMDSMAIHYNIDSLFKNSGIYIAHSKDKRIWVFSWMEIFNGTGNEPANVFFWRDSVDNPQGIKYFEPEYEKYFYYSKIYKLNNTDKDLYMLEGGTKDAGGVLKGVELTVKGINFNPKLFKIGDDFRSVYFLGDPCSNENDYYSFDKETQTITFSNCGDRGWNSYNGILTTGTLTFNGKYFTEKLKKQKYDVNE